MTYKRLKSIFNLGLLFAFPLFILVSIGWVLIPDKNEYIRELIAFGLLSSIGFLFLFLLNSSKIKTAFFYLFYLILSVFVVVKLSFYYHYKVKLSASAIFLIFETNGVEAKGFMLQYLNLKVLLLIALVTLPYVLYSFNLNFKRWVVSVLKHDLVLKPVVFNTIPVLLIAFSIYQIGLRFQSYNLFSTSYNSYKDYKITKALLKKNLSNPESNYLKVTTINSTPQTHVVIIGESTSSVHMQLYGYKRETNPELNKLKNELLVYNDVITPNTHTIVALDKILTFSDFKKPNKKENSSIIQLANAAGYKTYWLSNQQPVGMHETVATQIGYAADYKYFLTTNNSSKSNYDKVILPKLNSILNDAHSKRIIFIHLAGTHSVYKDHYPEEYNYFTTISDTLKTKKENKIINTYDNAIRYNDFIVSEIIKKVKRKQTNSYVVYFSDHGDEVYDTIDFAGHSEYHATNAMYQVPFVVWLSESYMQENRDVDLKLTINRNYILEDFIYSFSDLSNIEFDTYIPSKSIFSNQYIKKPRLIKDGENYDNR